jgi:Mg-chelatase subunit ChlD
VESICFSRGLDSYFREIREYWLKNGPSDESLRIDPPTMFFGSQTGVFRIFPGRPSKLCSPFSEYSAYDPRRRPWYVAASSGPKNIILVVDTSASMRGDRLKLLQEATIRIIETLAYGDRVAIVAFNDTAHVIADQNSDQSFVMFEATASNKNRTLQEVKHLSAGGNTNFIDALNVTFQIVQNTIEGEFIGTACNTAILFFTDGVMNRPDGITESTVKKFVSSRLTELSKNGTNRIFFFTYSLSSETGAQKLPMELACSSENGVWSKIDNNDEIVDSLNSYYQLFALGLGKENIMAWVEPYIYSTGGVLGTTVSRPVYDNSRDPAILIGVIGIDLPLGAIGKASDNKTSSEILADAVGAGTCPEVNLTVCLLESYRRLNGGATCNASCSENDLVDVKAANCSFLEKFPTNLWSNINSSGKLYVVSAGCKVVKYCSGVS